MNTLIDTALTSAKQDEFVSLSLDGMPFAAAGAAVRNRTKLDVPAEPCERLLLVLDGEADCLIGEWNLRMSKGAWINLPSGMHAQLSVYRSPVTARFALFSTEGGGGGHFAFGSTRDLPAWQEGAGRPFGFECGDIMGRAYFPADGSAHCITGPAFLLCLEDSCQINGQLITPEQGASIPCGETATIEPGAGGVIAVTKSDPALAQSYKQWMAERFGICWEEGYHRATIGTEQRS